MKKLITGYAALVSVAIIAATAQAATFTFVPNSSYYGADLGDLDHHYAYGWGIYGTQSGGDADALKAFLVTPNAFISSATLTISHIDNWNNASNRLYMDILDDPRKGVKRYADNSADTVFADYFDGNASFTASYLKDWSDTNGTGNAEDLVYNFTLSQLSTLAGFIIDNPNSPNSDRALFGIGFDPDCHFFNNGVSLTITTDSRRDSVPDGGTTASMLGGAFATIALLRRSQTRKAGSSRKLVL